jgi:hypothetical protein
MNKVKAVEGMVDAWVRGSTQGSAKQWSAHIVAALEPYEDEPTLHRKYCLIIVDYDTMNNCLRVKSAKWYYTYTAKSKENIIDEASYVLDLSPNQQQQLFDLVIKSKEVEYLKKNLVKKLQETEEAQIIALQRYEDSKQKLNDFILKIPNTKNEGILRS